MDWNAAIEKNREALKRVLAILVAMAGLGGGETTMPRHLHRAVLGLLRPAEAAARRLIIVTARGLVVALPPARPTQVGTEAGSPAQGQPRRHPDAVGKPSPARPIAAVARSPAILEPPRAAGGQRRATHLRSRLWRAVRDRGPPPAVA
jgi:hypothetical protein